jgi:hypothetical protein
MHNLFVAGVLACGVLSASLQLGTAGTQAGTAGAPVPTPVIGAPGGHVDTAGWYHSTVAPLLLKSPWPGQTDTADAPTRDRFRCGALGVRKWVLICTRRDRPGHLRLPCPGAEPVMPSCGLGNLAPPATDDAEGWKLLNAHARRRGGFLQAPHASRALMSHDHASRANDGHSTARPDSAL